MAARDVLKNVNLFVSGKGCAGQVEELNPPKLTLKTEEFQAGGMFSPVELTMAMEKLETDFTLISQDGVLVSTFGIVEGAVIPLTVRGHLESFDGTTSGVLMTMRVKIKEIDRGTWKPGEKASLKITCAVNYFKEARDGVTIVEIDVENMVYMQNGIDQLAAMRANLGM
jgi:uncharacterized protein